VVATGDGSDAAWCGCEFDGETVTDAVYRQTEYIKARADIADTARDKDTH
jgi:hypothetical protein